MPKRALVGLLDVQTPYHGQRQEAHGDVDDDVDNADGRVRGDLVAALPAGRRIPVLLDGTADEEAYEERHDHPCCLHSDDYPSEDLVKEKKANVSPYLPLIHPPFYRVYGTRLDISTTFVMGK